MARRIPARNVIDMRKAKAWAGYASHQEQKKMQYWREMLADGRLISDMLTPEERVELQDWIARHPKRTHEL